MCNSNRIVAAVLFWLVTSSITANPPSATPSAPRDPHRTWHTRENYAWPYDRGPFYAAVSPSRSHEAGVLHTPVGLFDLTLGSPDLPAALRAPYKLDTAAYQYFVVMTDLGNTSSDGLAAITEEIEVRGGAVVDQVVVAGLVARLNAEAHAWVRGRAGVVAVEPWHPAFKLSPGIGRAPLLDARAALSEEYDLLVQLFPGEQTTAVARQLAALGEGIQTVADDLLRVHVHRSRLSELAGLEAVQGVFEDVPIVLWGEEISQLVQTGTSTGAGPFNLDGVDGSGNGLPGTTPEVMMLLDSGIQLDAGDLSHTRLDAGTPSGTHRKVRVYQVTNQFPGGFGDLSGCDATSIFTHGHLMAAVALGNATDVPASYGAGWGTLDGRSRDGVAPGALLVAYDADAGGCGEPLADSLFPGDLYNAAGFGPNRGSLRVAAEDHGARVVNFSWGNAPFAVYNANARDVDQFLRDQPGAMVFVAAGNMGAGLAAESVGDPASAKNSVTVGATYNGRIGRCAAAPEIPCDTFPADTDACGAEFFPTCLSSPNPGQEVRWPESSVGPIVPSFINRVAPILMAPGADLPGADAQEGFACVTSDDNQTNPVECSAIEGITGTSVAAAAASGTALLVRDYFQQGFWPDGTSSDPGNAADMIPEVSGALVKAVLVASADWMNDPDDPTLPGGNLSVPYRFNNEQGYGRIQLTNALRLASLASSADGVHIHDPLSATTSLGLPFSLAPGAAAVAPFAVLDDTRELRVALVWMDLAPVGGSLRNNLNLTLTSPTGKTYFGNYFTDDNDKDGILDAAPAEDCPPIGALAPNGAIDAGPWSLPTCVNSITDSWNPVEGVFLSPDPDGNGSTVDGVCTVSAGPCGKDEECPGFPGEACVGGTNQIELGGWAITVSAGAGNNGAQSFAVVIAASATPVAAILLEDAGMGPEAAGASSGVSEAFDCTSSVSLRILETDEADDPAAGLTPAEVSSRCRIRVINPGGTLADEESGFPVVQPDPGILRFESGSVALAASNAPVMGNGLVEVQHGQTLEAVYDDESLGVAEPELRALSTSRVTCGAFTPGEVREVAVTDFDPATGNISFTYAPGCSSSNNTIVFGPLQAVGSYQYSGQDCEIGNSGSYDAFNPGGGSYFFLVVASDGDATEGSYGVRSSGSERPELLTDPTCSLDRDLASRCD